MSHERGFFTSAHCHLPCAQLTRNVNGGSEPAPVSYKATVRETGHFRGMSSLQEANLGSQVRIPTTSSCCLAYFLHKV